MSQIVNEAISRRNLLTATVGGVVAASSFSVLSAETKSQEESVRSVFHPNLRPPASGLPPSPKLALNTATIMGFNLPLEKEIELTSQAGYQAIEVWMNKIHRFLEQGGTTSELKKRFSDANLLLINAVSFPQWIVDDPQRRARGVEQMKKEMEILAEIGCPCIAAPASGATDRRIDDLQACGQRYRTILELGEQIGVIPLLELWGASQTLSRLSDGVAIAVAAEHEKASLLLDAYHLYRGGNRFEGLTQISGRSLHIFHLNDYPGDPPREKLNDSDRVYPGDGICPIAKIVQTLQSSGFDGFLSLELFNRSYWENGDPLSVAKTGLEKMKNVLKSVFETT